MADLVQDLIQKIRQRKAADLTFLLPGQAQKT
jgi:hypothetical protein